MKWEFQTRIAEDGDEERSAAKSRRESEERERGERREKVGKWVSGFGSLCVRKTHTDTTYPEEETS